MGSGATKFDEIHAPSCQILFPMLAHQPPDNVAASTAFPGTNTQGGGEGRWLVRDDRQAVAPSCI